MARATIEELKKNRLETMTADERAVFDETYEADLPLQCLVVPPWARSFSPFLDQIGTCSGGFGAASGTYLYGSVHRGRRPRT
jgi:hypothetical protein